MAILHRTSPPPLPPGRAQSRVVPPPRERLRPREDREAEEVARIYRQRVEASRAHAASQRALILRIWLGIMGAALILVLGSLWALHT